MKNLQEIIEQAYQRANAEFNRLYPTDPVPATVTFGADQMKAELVKLIEEIEEEAEEESARAAAQQADLERPR